MGNLATNWLKRIFSVTTITTIATVLAACIAVIEYVERNGGTFLAFVNNKEAIPPVNRTILVYLDKDSADLAQIGIFPQITNPSKYALQDVLLTYKIVSHSTNVSFTDYFSVHRLAQGDEVTNLDKTLYAKTDMPEPFYYFIMRDKGEASVNLRATYKGVDEPFSFQANVYANKLFLNDKEERKHVIFDDAKQFLSRNNVNNIDLYILESNSVESFENMSAGKLTIGDENISENKNVTASVSKPIEQIVSEKKDVAIAAQEQIGMPWYMYIVGGVLFIIGIVLFLVVILMGVMMNDLDGLERVKAVIVLIISCVFLFISMYYAYEIFGLISDVNFWKGSLYYIAACATLGLITYCTHKTNKYFSLKDEDLFFFIYLFIAIALWVITIKYILPLFGL